MDDSFRPSVALSGDDVVLSPLLRDAGVPHGFFTRRGGVSAGAFESLNGGFDAGDQADRVTENRRRVARFLDVEPRGLVFPSQEHGTTVTSCGDGTSPPRADGMISGRSDRAVGILTADCGPLLLADVEIPVVAAVHAGWKGALAGVVEAALQAMGRQGAKADRIIAALGPMIGGDSYEVSSSLRRSFLTPYPESASFFDGGRRILFDLGGFILWRLAKGGVTHCDNLRADTYQQKDRFFSYRRACHGDRQSRGRQMSAIRPPSKA